MIPVKILHLKLLISILFLKIPTLEFQDPIERELLALQNEIAEKFPEYNDVLITASKPQIIANLQLRFELEQWIREKYVDLRRDGGSPDSLSILSRTMQSIDKQNLSFAKQFLDKNGWPLASDWNADTPKHIWFIIQHSNVNMMSRILYDVKLAVERGELTPWNYAAMFDRIENYSGRPQHFGTQFTCIGNSYEYIDMLEPDKLIERRNSINYNPKSELFGKPC